MRIIDTESKQTMSIKKCKPGKSSNKTNSDDNIKSDEEWCGEHSLE